MIRSNSRLIAPSSSGPRLTCCDVREHFRLARRLVDLDARASSSRGRSPARRRRAPLSSAHQLLVELVDALPQGLDDGFTGCSSASARTRPRVRATSGASPCSRNHVDQRAADDGGIGPAAGLGDVLGRRDAEADRKRQRRLRRVPARAAPATSAASRSRMPVTPSREMTYRNPRPSSADRRIRASVVVGLTRKIGSSPASTSGCAERLRLLDRVVEDQHAVDARVGRGRAANAAGVHAQDRVGVGEEHDRRIDGCVGPARTSIQRAAQRHPAQRARARSRAG